jgi:hypothetical protein
VDYIITHSGAEEENQEQATGNKGQDKRGEGGSREQQRAAESRQQTTNSKKN